MVYRNCSNCGFAEDECLCCPKCGHYDMCDCECYHKRKAEEAEKTAYLLEQREAESAANQKL